MNYRVALRVTCGCNCVKISKFLTADQMFWDRCGSNDRLQHQSTSQKTSTSMNNCHIVRYLWCETARQCLHREFSENGIMSNLFKGWRAKVGVTMLVLGLVFMAGWIRSQRIADIVLYPAEQNTIGCLVSSKDSLVWQRTQITLRTAELGINVAKGPTQWTWKTLPVSEYIAILDSGLNWRWRWCGFGVANSPSEMTEQTGISATLLFIPYWSFAIPLTLISACLILSKPRSAKQTNSIEQTTAMAA